VDINEIQRRLPRTPTNHRDQVVLRMRDLKDKAADIARREGLRVLPSSCAANIEAHQLGCWSCKWGPCGNLSALPRVYDDDVREILEMEGCRPRWVKVRDNSIDALCDKRPRESTRVVLETLSKRTVRIKARK
jgi:hypothetical protein